MQKIDNNEFTDIKLFENQIYEESSEISNARLISKIIIDELEIWWKNQIDIFDSKSNGKFQFLLKLDNSDLQKNIDVEKIKLEKYWEAKVFIFMNLIFKK